MRIRVCIARLAVPVVAAAILLFAAGRGSVASAQQAPAAGVEVKIDNFSFGPAALTVRGGDDGYLDESRRHSPYRGQRRQGL